MEAFEEAVGLGYSHVETDLHVTRDGVLVCIHDETVDRTTDGAGRVAALTYEEIQKLDAGYRHRSKEGYEYRATGIRVPAFEEVVKAFPDVRFVVDLKSSGVEEPLAALIDRHGLHDRLIAGSFSDARLIRFRRLTEGSVPTSTGREASRMWVLASRVGRLGPVTASALQLPTRMKGLRVVDERLVTLAQKAGLQVHVWTVNRVEDMSFYLDIGVDGVITDRPDLLRALLVERGEWKE